MMVAEEKMVAWPKWRLGGGAKTLLGEALKSPLVIPGNFELIFQFLPFIFNCDIIN